MVYRPIIALLIFGMASLAYGQTNASGRLMIVVEFEVKPEHRDELIEALKAQAQTAHTEDGCQQFDVLPPNDNPKHVLLVEKWRDEAAHTAHLNGPSFAKARDATKEWIVNRKVTSGITD